MPSTQLSSNDWKLLLIDFSQGAQADTMFTMTVDFGEVVDYLLLHLPFLKPAKIVGVPFKMLII